MIILILSYLLPLHRIGSIALSEKIDENFKIVLDELSIVFSKEVYLVLSDEFNVADKEFKICLKGKKNGDLVVIDSYYLPKVLSSSFVSVRSEGCDSETLISMHSHPSGFCIFSNQDINNYKRMQNPDAFIGLICGVDRFNFYGFQNNR